jgi:cystathionine gamma-synthase
VEGGAAGFAFASGMAAISALMETLPRESHVIVSDDLYGGTFRLFSILEKRGMTFTYTDTSKPDLVEAAFRSGTKMLFIETPTNPMMKVADIALLSGMAHARGILCAVDNTFLSPYFQRPLAHGADVVLHSATKYLGGHNDLIAGLLVTKEAALGEEISYVLKSVGNMLGPFDSWLLLRGMKTLALRMEKHQANAFAIAAWLKEQPQVDRVYYAGFPDHESAAVSARQTSGHGGMMSFSVKDPALVNQILSRVKLILFAESLGGVETLITFPLVQTHAAIPREILDRLGVTDKLLRLSVGIEAVEDLIADLKQAMAG